MIEDILQREWDFFQEVRHIDGRASCQDDKETFYLQRRSQFELFPLLLQESYLADLKYAREVGRNLVMEKYAYMMESTDPDYYASIKESLPLVSSEKRNIIDAICQIEVDMREKFNQQYPHLALQARYTHTSEDGKEDTSFETYLRGELSTYSTQTLYLYGEMVVDYLKQKRNIIVEIMEKTVLSYGYHSLKEAEEIYEKR